MEVVRPECALLLRVPANLSTVTPQLGVQRRGNTGVQRSEQVVPTHGVPVNPHSVPNDIVATLEGCIVLSGIEFSLVNLQYKQLEHKRCYTWMYMS